MSGEARARSRHHAPLPLVLIVALASSCGGGGGTHDAASGASDAAAGGDAPRAPDAPADAAVAGPDGRATDAPAPLATPEVRFVASSLGGYRDLLGLTLDEQYAYVTNFDLTTPGSGETPPTVAGVAKDGSGSAVIEYGYYATAVVADGTDVYWAGFTLSGSQTTRLVRGGGFGRPVQRLSEQPYDRPLALATQPLDPYLYVLVEGQRGAIARFTKGVAYQQPVYLGTPLVGTPYVTTLGAVAIDATSVFWCDPDGGAVRRVARTGVGPTDDVATGQQPRAVAVDPQGGDVLWLSSSASGTLMKRAKSGGDPVVLAQNLAFPVGLAIDADDAYVTTAGSGAHTGSVVRVSRADGVVTELAVGEQDPGAIAIDATHVYWIAGNQLRALPKR